MQLIIILKTSNPIDQPAHLEKTSLYLLSYSTYPFQIARLCTCYNTSGAPIDSSDIFVFTFAIFYASIFALAEAFALIQILAPGLPNKYTNKILQKPIRLTLETFVRG